MASHSSTIAAPAHPASRSFVVPLSAAVDPATCGNKACHLARVAALGLRVPAAVVVTNTALDACLDARSLDEQIEALSREADVRSTQDPAGISGAIRAIVLATRVPAELAVVIQSSVEALGRGPFMVRSSAHGEDATGASFAGQLDSTGDVYPGPELTEAVVKVWASRWSHRAIAYGRARGAALDGMGVIVQRQVASLWSGVLFTEAPGDQSQMLLEFCRGMGEALVSGLTDPGRITISRGDLRSSVLAQGGGETAVDRGPDEVRVAEIARAALIIERAFGAPQDIEWAIDGNGRLWIVQARPITAGTATRSGHHATTTSIPAPQPGPAASRPAIPTPCPANRDTSSVCWSNANISENFPGPVSPLLYSIASAGYYHYFRNLGRSFGLSRGRIAAMELPLRRIVGVHGARLYYNLTSIHAVLRSAPFGELLAASFNDFVGSEPTATAPAVPFARRTTRFVAHALESTRIVVQTSRQYVALERRVRRFERRVDAFAARTHPGLLPERALDALLDDFRGFLHIRCRQWNDAALADAGSMVCYGLLQRLLRRAFPEDDQQALHNSLLKALPGLVSGLPAIELWKLAERVRADPELTSIFALPDADDVLRILDHDTRFPEFRRALAEFQETWGFRCSGELMLTVPSFQENPAPLVALIRSYLDSSGDSPSRVLEKQGLERCEATARVRRELRTRRVFPFVPRMLQRLLVMRVLRWTQACICLRERARLKQALLYSRLRRIVCEIGKRLTENGRLGAADDIFFVTADEIESLLSGGAMFPDIRDLVVLRRKAHAALATLTPPDTFTLRQGEYFTAWASAPSAPPNLGAMKGIGACGGVAMAAAAVLSDVTESDRLRAGDILVTRQTDPGWAPVFPLIAGLVVERGGMLSHGAIIAREFGIPSVVGVRDATARIPHRALVVVNGDCGTVEIAEAPAAEHEKLG